ncbi:DUF221-domain-containing protein [Ascobolus immersus RN42]|uniref:DUF221-domain-containing protein n=1 Tax=Ascobolus immersus RN42 TaxID=1160509 RepID=A0A3N4I302_ASCIM|nr:DUF221-domain-containing protein [Ascobolus immersus RN42]
MSVFPYAELQYSLRYLEDDDDDKDGNPLNPRHKQKAHGTQLVISISLGLLAFTLFCFLRPRWQRIYASRALSLRNSGTVTTTGSPGSGSGGQLTAPTARSALPTLPQGMFAWIPVIYNISEHQVLASAGLDAFVFLGFFKMAIQFLLIAAVFGAAVLLPLHKHYGPNTGRKLPGYPGHDSSKPGSGGSGKVILSKRAEEKEPVDDTTYLWAYVFFVWLFSLVCIKLLVRQTEKVVRVRQEYLGTHCTTTDRTFRLSGIPEQERTPDLIKEYVEQFGVGEVERVMICRHWACIDEMLEKREKVKRKLECAYTELYKARIKGGVSVNTESHTPAPARDESREPLLPGYPDDAESQAVGLTGEGPKIRIRYGLFKLRSRKVYAIPYYQAWLEKLDAKIRELRRKEHTPTASAFVTMKSAASAQMAVQTLLAPEPHRYSAHLAPAPKDIVWKNTYMTKRERIFRAWTISICISLLTVLWLGPISLLATVLNLKSLERVWPGLARLLGKSELISSLIQNFAPTLILTLLNVAIPYLYDFLSQFQGFISESDVELSVISKNFFFTFFNLFFAFSVFGTAANMYSMIKESIHDTTKIAFALAGSLEEMAPFYINLIILQGIGMFPIRLLDVGSVFLYPFQRMGLRTPTDKQYMERPPVFKYGFYLPQPILILILCIIYSVMPSGGFILLFGLIYFIMGYFTFKYQLLYSMTHNVHSTGKAWPLISYRIIVGLLLFQITMAALLATRKAFYRALMVFPILMFTFWFAWYFRAVYAPLTEYVALQAIKVREGNMSPLEIEDHMNDYHVAGVGGQWDSGSMDESVPHRSRKFEEAAEGTVFEHPGLTKPLEPVDPEAIKQFVEKELGYRTTNAQP